MIRSLTYMIKLELEQVLEDGFKELGVELERRVYKEEILVGESVDDAVSGKSLRDDTANFSTATKFQKAAYFAVNGSLFFQRRIENYDGWLIEYTTRTHEEEQSYEQATDRIIKEVLEQLNMLGYGVGTIDSKNNNEMTIKFTDCILLKQSLQFMNTFNDDFIKGIILGLAILYGKRVSEIKLSYTGKTKLSLKIVFSGKVDLVKELDEKVQSSQIKKITDDRMKRKYYLSPS